ncbi:MAG: HEAT repeat domain-containing protein [Planctomycetes bacterium]|nr:HEAT repeat domain-containing protein [Planctomycetota bacterium]
MKRLILLLALAALPMVPLRSDPEGAPRRDAQATRYLADRVASHLLSEDGEVRSRAGEELVRGMPANEEVFEALILYADPKVREYAISLAGNLGAAGGRLVPAILKVLSDPDDVCRWRAAYELGRIGPAAKDAAPELVRQMLDPSFRNQVAATWAVAALGEGARDALVEQLREPSPLLAARAFDKLSGPGVQIKGGDACAVGALVHALRKHPEPAIRGQAARVIRRLHLGTPDEERALIEAALDDESPDVRIAAAQALATAAAERRPDIVRGLREGRHDPDPKARAAILEALKSLGAGEEDLK